MRLFFAASLVSVFTSFSAFAEGLPANPWTAHAARGSLPAVAQVQNTAASQAQNFDTKELNEVISALKNAVNDSVQAAQNNGASRQASAQASDFTDTADNMKALWVLSQYLKKNQSENSSQNISDDGIKQIMRILAQSGGNNAQARQAAPSVGLSPQAKRQLNSLKYEYNKYRSQLVSNYNYLRKQAKPLVNTMEKSMNEAQRATGIKF